jgi:hypothetical protein
MRITKEISGNAQERQSQERQGRGEYEICEDFELLRPPDLFNRRILLELPNGRLVDTATQLKLQGGKRRIRIIDGTREVGHVYRQIAALLLMPKPSRSEPSWGDGTPVMRTDQYGIINMDLTNVVLDGEDRVRVEMGTIQLANQFQQETIRFSERFAKVKEIWSNKSKFESEISGLLAEHQDLIESGRPLGPQAERVVGRLQRVMSDTGSDYGILGNSPTTDVLPSLRQVIV